MDKKNYNIAKKIYMKILIVLFSVSSVIAIVGRTVKQILRGYGYVFHSWLSVTYLVAWVLMIGLILIITLSYLNVWLGSILIPFILFVAFIGGCLGYDKEIKKGSQQIPVLVKGKIAVHHAGDTCGGDVLRLSDLGYGSTEASQCIL